jgi:hypothetical protein
VSNLILCGKLQFSCSNLGVCDSAELTSSACLSSAISLPILAVKSQYISLNTFLCSPCCCVSSRSLYCSRFCTAFYSSHTFCTNCSLTFTLCTSTFSCKLSVSFLFCVTLALTAGLFLGTSFRVWESMVLRTGKKRANLQFYVPLRSRVSSRYPGNNAAWKLSSVLSKVNTVCCAVTCSYAVSRSSYLKLSACDD